VVGPIANGCAGRRLLRSQLVPDNGVTAVGAPLLLLTTFNFLDSEESRVPIYCWMNRESRVPIYCWMNRESFKKKPVLKPCFDPKTFSTSGEHSNHSAMAT